MNGRRAAPPLCAAFALAACGEAAREPGASRAELSARPPPAAAAPATAPARAPLSDEERRGLTGSVAFVAERHGQREVYLLDPATLAERRLTDSPVDEYPMAASPDGRELLLATADERGGAHVEQLARLPLAGGAPAPFGPKSKRVRTPSWSPDGRWVYFESDAASFSDVYRARPDGSQLERLTRGGAEGNFSPALSPDGKTVAFVSGRDGDPEVYAMNADGSRARRLTAFHAEDWAPAWSPRGDRLAFSSAREGAEHVFLMAPSGAEQRRVTGGRGPGGGANERASVRVAGPGVDEGEVAWAPSGRALAFRAKAPGGKAVVRAYDLDAERAFDLTDGASNDGSPAWSPDGRYVAFVSDRSGDGDLYVVRADGSGTTRLTTAPGADWLPRWLAAAPGDAAAPRPAGPAGR